jgi:hypothetical protein
MRRLKVLKLCGSEKLPVGMDELSGLIVLPGVLPWLSGSCRQLGLDFHWLHSALAWEVLMEIGNVLWLLDCNYLLWHSKVSGWQQLNEKTSPTVTLAYVVGGAISSR